MPLARFVLMLVLVVVAAAATVAVGAFISAASLHPAIGLLLAVPLALVAYVVLRVIRDRVSSAEDGHYDRIEK